MCQVTMSCAVPDSSSDRKKKSCAGPRAEPRGPETGPVHPVAFETMRLLAAWRRSCQTDGRMPATPRRSRRTVPGRLGNCIGVPHQEERGGEGDRWSRCA